MKKVKNNPSSYQIAIVASQFNDFITKRLLAGCVDELKKQGIDQTSVDVYWVPGSFEIPVVALKLARKKNINAVICLGAVIRGETYHFELIAQSAANGIMQASILSGKPVIFGVLSTDTVGQAYKRCDDKKGNKGRDAALAAIDMIRTLKAIH